MLEMWALVWVFIYDPVHGAVIESLGTYPSYETCQYEMREAEIMVNRTNEGMLCLQIEPPTEYFIEPEPAEAEGVLQ